MDLIFNQNNMLNKGYRIDGETFPGDGALKEKCGTMVTM